MASGAVAGSGALRARANRARILHLLDPKDLQTPLGADESELGPRVDDEVEHGQRGGRHPNRSTGQLGRKVLEPWVVPDAHQVSFSSISPA